MTCAAEGLVLLLLSTFLSNAVVTIGEEVCRSKNIEQLVQLLGSYDVKKIEKKVETKVMLAELLKECKSHSRNTSHQETKVDALVENQITMQRKLNDIENTLASILAAVSKPAPTAQPTPASIIQPEQCAVINKRISKSELLKLTTGTFYFERTRMGAKMARGRCKALALQTVKFASVREMTEVASALVKRNRTTILEASGHGSASKNYKWDDGTTINSRLWSDGYPLALHGQQPIEPVCVFLSMFTGKLKNQDCSRITGYPICRLPTNLTVCFKF